MKLKNSVLLDETFISALRFFSKQHIPVVVSYRLDKCLDVLQKEYERFDKHRRELYAKYALATHNEDGSTMYDILNASEEKKSLFSKEFSDLIDIEFELPVENKIELNISKLSNIDISVEYFNKLKMLIDFKE